MMPGAALFLIALLAKATVILAAAWLLASVLRRGSAAIRHGVWSAALAAILALPLLGGRLPALEIPLPDALTPSAVARNQSRALPPAPAAGSAPAGSSASLTRPAIPPPEAIRSTPAPPAPGFDPWLLLLAGWLLGVGGRGAWLLMQMRKVRRIVRGAAPLDGELLREAERIFATTAPVRRGVRLLASARVSTPLTCGVARPVILLPRDAAEWSPARLRVVLLHELAHIRRWDYLLCLLAEGAAAFYWPLPLVWLARARLHGEQEQASDDLVLAEGTQPVDYADHLLAIARALRGENASPAASIGMAREVGLKRRVRTILDPDTPRAPLRSARGAIAVAMLAATALPVAAARPANGADGGQRADARRAPAPTHSAALPAAYPAVLTSFSADDVPARHAYLWLEAEHGLRRGGAALREDLDASGGQYLLLPAESGAGESAYSLHLPRRGEYRLWARVAGPLTSGMPALSVSIDGGSEVVLEEAVPAGDGLAEWRWLRAGGIAPGSLDLPAGVHTLRVAGPGGLRVDRILVTSDAAFVPAGAGAAAERASPEHRWLDVSPGVLTRPVELEVEVSGEGPYVLWGRVLGRSEEANSFRLSIDGGPEMVWDAPRRELTAAESRWTWDPASARSLDGRPVDPLILDLTPGNHSIRISPREPGTGLGGLLLTNDLAYRPIGPRPGTEPVRIWLEPERAEPADALQIRFGGGSMGDGYIEASRRGPLQADPGEGGAAILRFDVPVAGIYSLWARAAARNDGEDSFWIRVNGGEWLRWNGIPRSRGWQWSTVHDGDGAGAALELALPAGENRIEIARREGGARLDRLLLTNTDFLENVPATAE